MATLYMAIMQVPYIFGFQPHTKMTYPYTQHRPSLTLSAGHTGSGHKAIERKGIWYNPVDMFKKKKVWATLLHI